MALNTLHYLVIFSLLLVNAMALVMVGLDKRKSIKGEERFPEVSFFLMSAIFGSLGIFLGIFLFRHKTKKIYFPLGVGLILMQQIALLMLLYNRFVV